MRNQSCCRRSLYLCDWASDCTITPTEPPHPPYVFWQALLCKQLRLFKATELSNIYCLVKGSVRNYDISHRSNLARRGGEEGGGDFPLFPQTNPVWAEIHRSVQKAWWLRLRLILFNLKQISEGADALMFWVWKRSTLMGPLIKLRSLLKPDSGAELNGQIN